MNRKMEAIRRSVDEQTVVFTANRGYALTNSRVGLLRRFLDQGWTTVLATADDRESRSLERLGVHVEPVVFQRGGVSPVRDSLAYRRLVAVCRRWQPSLIQQFHAKPAILGTLAARRVLGGSTIVSNTITGLGYAFTAGGLAARMAGWGYAFSMPRADAIVFQNEDDRRLFIEQRWVSDRRAHLIASAGIDVARFSFVDRSARSAASPRVVMLGRLLRQKGIAEFAAAAREVRRRWPSARFLLAGEEDTSHPDAFPVSRLRESGDVEFLGRLQDVSELLRGADILLFPSYYREGTPRVVLEAAATGLPTVAFDVPGVREAVRHGQTGYLVPLHDMRELCARVQELLENSDRRIAMGAAARRMVESEFDRRVIEDRYMERYRALGVHI